MQKKKRIIFFGDSITEFAVQPQGYITKMQQLLVKDKQENNYELAGAGVSSNKIYDLYLRMDDDVISKNPDVVVIFIGVNDVWHKRSLGTGTDADKFERFYNAILKKLGEKNIKVIICTPAAIGERIDFSNELDGDLNNYCNIVRHIAATHNVGLVDLRKAFTEYDRQHNPGNLPAGILTTDGVHLNEQGNEFVAEQMWQVISKQ
ncbi:MAG: GDSL-type esterase/lipase family protein [Ginsengibacter sp.]